MLSPDEQQRASRLRFVEDRDRFVARRSLLRVVLARYLDVPPAAVEIGAGANGKPRLGAAHVGSGIRFSQSVSGELTLVAVAEGREVGVDVERIDAHRADEEVARRFFSPAEVTVLRSSPSEIRTERFFACWTMKEAFVKAVGLGLSLPLDAFDVDPTREEASALLATRWDAAEAARWTLRALDIGDGYRAAIAVAGRAEQVHILA